MTPNSKKGFQYILEKKMVVKESASMSYTIKFDKPDPKEIKSFIKKLQDKKISIKKITSKETSINLSKNKNDIDEIVQIADELGVAITIKGKKE